MVWLHPTALLGLAVVPLYWAADIWLSRFAPAILHGNVEALPALPKGVGPTLFRRSMRSAAIALIVLGIARPSVPADSAPLDVRAGVSICVALDLSRSMRAEDFQPNRLEAAKETLKRFARRRQNDRIGLIAFAGEALLQAPLTLDHAALERLIDQTNFGLLQEEGTAVGDALVKAAARLKDVPGKSRLIVLVTDGENNRGSIDPLTAASAAAEIGIRVFAVGVGSAEGAPIPFRGGFVRGPGGARLITRVDEDLLRQIAAMTGGRYFNAADRPALEAAMAEIDRMETAPMSAASTAYEEISFWLYLSALLLTAAESVLSRTVLRTLPG